MTTSLGAFKQDNGGLMTVLTRRITREVQRIVDLSPHALTASD